MARALLAAQQGLLFMNRTGLDTATLTATARSLADRLLPDHRHRLSERGRHTVQAVVPLRARSAGTEEVTALILASG